MVVVIALTNSDRTALVDAADAQRILACRWRLANIRGREYAVTYRPGGTLTLQQVVLRLPPGRQSRFRSTNRLDCRRANLTTRETSHA